MKCPKNWKPHCSCSMTSLEPYDRCWIHGIPDWRFCPYCGKFRYDNICTSCGCRYGVTSKWKKIWNSIINKIDSILEEGNLYKKGDPVKKQLLPKNNKKSNFLLISLHRIYCILGFHKWDVKYSPYSLLDRKCKYCSKEQFYSYALGRWFSYILFSKKGKKK